MALDHFKVYDLDDFITKLHQSLAEVSVPENLFEGYNRLKNINKKKDFVSRISSQPLLKYVLQKNLSIEEMSILAASKPKVFIIYLLLRS